MNPRSLPPTRPPRRRPEKLPWILTLCLLAAGSPDLRPDVVLEESYDLEPGWNLIHIPLEPLEKDANAALAAVDWESLWTWLPDLASDTGLGRGGRWLVRYKEAPDFLSSQGSFTGPASYAILMRSAGTLRIKGQFRPDRQALRGFAFHLFGPRVPESSPPSVSKYFSRPGVLENIGEVHELAGGTYRKLQPGDALRHGASYWVRPAQNIPEPNPLRVGAGFGGLRFSAQTTLQEIEIDLGVAADGGGAGTPEPRRLKLKTIPSADSLFPADWLDLQKPDGTFAPLIAGSEVEVDPEATRARIAVRARQDGVAAPNAARKALAIEVTGSAGSVLVGADLDLATKEGTWIGEAFLDEVERPSIYGEGYAPTSRLPLSIILEVPGTGRPRLLPCIQLEGDRDARKIKYRLEAALFHEVVDLFGTLDASGTNGTLLGTVSLPPGHALNPYRHRYNPEHVAGYDITRSVKLSFGASIPGQEPAPGAEGPFDSVGVLSGVYEEEIVGLTQEPIRVRGSFRLRRLTGGTATPCATAGQ